jgi:hypothetical protein
MKISVFWNGCIVSYGTQVAAFEFGILAAMNLNSASAGLFEENWK